MISWYISRSSRNHKILLNHTKRNSTFQAKHYVFCVFILYHLSWDSGFYFWDRRLVSYIAHTSENSQWTFCRWDWLRYAWHKVLYDDVNLRRLNHLSLKLSMKPSNPQEQSWPSIFRQLLQFVWPLVHQASNYRNLLLSDCDREEFLTISLILRGFQICVKIRHGNIHQQASWLYKNFQLVTRSTNNSYTSPSTLHHPPPLGGWYLSFCLIVYQEQFLTPFMDYQVLYGPSTINR